MKALIIRLLVVILFPVNIAAACAYGIVGMILLIPAWIITGNSSFADLWFKEGPEMFIMWPIKIWGPRL